MKIAVRAGHPISLWELTGTAMVMAAIPIFVAASYLWLLYFVLF
ncbi:hypothetical protein [Kribbella capetownensis]|nr:hypothetical protein [Kribbella capetownensis]